MSTETEITETERRFVIRGIDPDIQRSPSRRIVQGYFTSRSPDLSFRVRISNERKAELTKKYGSGQSRQEKTHPIDLAAAQFLMDPDVVDIVEKIRYERDGFEVDYFEGPLGGLVLAEFEHPDADALVRPPWIHDWFEVTDSLTNQHLARLARDLMDATLDRPVREYIAKRLPRMVLTGGPCSGKTALMAIIRQKLGDLLHCVPETATMVIAEVGVKPPADPIQMGRFQRTVHRVQCGFEDISELQALSDHREALLLDRGALDGAAYMQRGVVDFEKACHTSRSYEYRRYDAVFYLESPPRDVYEANRANNPARSETYEQMLAVAERTREVWGGHPNFVPISNGSSWDEKAERALAHIKRYLTFFKKR